MSAQPQFMNELAQGSIHAVGSRAAVQQPRRPAPQPAQDPAEVSERLFARAQRKGMYLLSSAGLMAVIAVVGGTFVNGSISVANEAHRGVQESRKLEQQQNLLNYYENRQAKSVTPTSIGNHAAAAGMVHAEERDTIVLP